MPKSLRAQLKALGIGSLVEKMSDEQLSTIEEMIQEHSNRVMAYMVDADEMHQLLALAYTMDSGQKADELQHMATHCATIIRAMYKRSKVITLGNLATLTDVLEELAKGINKDAPPDDSDKQAKEDDLPAGC